jgi:hypothetical protein
LLFMLVAATCVPGATVRAGITWNEIGDAGQNGPAAAQIVTGSGTLDSILGVIGQDLGGSDADVYQILITDFQIFSAQTSGALDTMLWLFKADGTGQVMNDDIVNGSNTLSILTSQGVFANGLYYLAVSRFNNRPQDVGNTDLFSSTSTWPGPHAGQYQPNGAAGAFHHWTGSGGATGGYMISLTGASAVPAPGALATMLTLVALAGPRRRR